LPGLAPGNFFCARRREAARRPARPACFNPPMMCLWLFRRANLPQHDTASEGM
jgi:hypothetical protein